MKDSRLVSFGLKVREIRKQQGISQEKLAELSDTDRSYMGRIERGEKNVTLTKMYQIANALKIDIIKFFI
ncbi:MAG: helix-turn-helix transcriptional regulator [Colwellia sp.]|nr:helix-turn-helix transcriptional regulator [Colwellia sp.]